MQKAHTYIFEGFQKEILLDNPKQIIQTNRKNDKQTVQNIRI